MLYLMRIKYGNTYNPFFLFITPEYHRFGPALDKTSYDGMKDN